MKLDNLTSLCLLNLKNESGPQAFTQLPVIALKYRTDGSTILHFHATNSVLLSVLVNKFLTDGKTILDNLCFLRSNL
jgi:hypothetical protein